MGSQSNPGLVTRSGGQCLADLAAVAKQAYHGEAVRWTVLACATTVEAHVDRVVEALVDGSDVSTSRFGGALLDEVRSTLSQSWDRRLGWLNRGFDVSITGTKETQEFLTLIDFRNAVVHGHMHLTDIQVVKLEAMIDLKRRLRTILDVHSVGRMLVAGDATAMKAVRVSRAFVYSLDAAVVCHHPALRV